LIGPPETSKSWASRAVIRSTPKKPPEHASQEHAAISWCIVVAIVLKGLRRAFRFREGARGVVGGRRQKVERRKGSSHKRGRDRCGLEREGKVFLGLRW